jgi:hypothetical protein
MRPSSLHNSYLYDRGQKNVPFGAESLEEAQGTQERFAVDSGQLGGDLFV